MLLPLLRCQITHLIEHIFNENSVPRGGIVDQHVGDRSHQLTVLNYGRATHTLNDTARLLYQRGVGDLDGEAFI